MPEINVKIMTKMNLLHLVNTIDNYEIFYKMICWNLPFIKKMYIEFSDIIVINYKTIIRLLVRS